MLVPPYVPAKSKALKNMSGSSNDSANGGINVKRYGRGWFCPVGSFSTEQSPNEGTDIRK